jgi:psiF repeat
MRRSMWMMAVSAMLVVGALGQPASADNSQQAKMTTCNADATSKGLSGDNRKTFMKTCLSAGSTTSKPVNSQQEKMKTCNADATTKGLTGDDRKKFMSSCLKGTS